MTPTDTIRNTFFPSFTSSPFGMMAKAVGSQCNLACDYCYYLEKEKLYRPSDGRPQMTPEVLEAFIQQYISSQPTRTVSFIWQGGEPCLAGIEFYRQAVALQRKYAQGKVIENSLQTNGTLLDERWCEFLKEHNFLVGISIDGPQEIHDRYRQNKAGRGSFAEALRAIELLNKYRIEFNTLTTINRYTSHYPLEIYRFLKSLNSHYMQFIPVVERVSVRKQETGLSLVPNNYTEETAITDFTVDPVQFGKFMIAVFDEWVRRDVSYYFVQLFDSTLANRVGETPGICMYAASCGHAGLIEHNGDVYACDHFVFPGFLLGNILQTPLAEMMNATQQQVFGQAKFSQLPGSCYSCKYFKTCYGECPKKRFLRSPDGEYGLNYLCEGYKLFYEHVGPYMDYMAEELQHERSPANIMQHLARHEIL